MRTQPVRLLGQELRGVRRLLLTDLQVLVQVQRGQLVGHLLRPLGGLAVEGQGERDGGAGLRPAAPVDHIRVDDIELDVLAHAIEDFLAGLVLPQPRIQVVLVDDLQQPGARHHLLGDDLDALVGVAADGAAHQVLGDLLFFDQDGRRGSVDRRQHDRDDGGDQQHQAGRDQHRLVPASDRRDVVVQVPLGFVDEFFHGLQSASKAGVGLND